MTQIFGYSAGQVFNDVNFDGGVCTCCRLIAVVFDHTLVKILLSPSFGTTKCAKFEHVALQCPFDDPDLGVLSRMNAERWRECLTSSTLPCNAYLMTQIFGYSVGQTTKSFLVR